MSQNRTPAVMQQRAPRPAVPAGTQAPVELDYFPTPPWATRAVCEWLDDHRPLIGSDSCWEPACGEGHMTRPLREYFANVWATDIHPYGAEDFLHDFIGMRGMRGLPFAAGVDWTFTNPPFLHAAAFIARALEISRTGVVMIARQAFTEGEKRYKRIFSTTPPAFELQFTERVVMLRGRLIRTNAPDPFNLDATGTPRKASTASACIALVWLRGRDGQWITDTRKRWLAPCRQRLERAGDYPEYPEQWAKIARTDEGAML